MKVTPVPLSGSPACIRLSQLIISEAGSAKNISNFLSWNGPIFLVLRAWLRLDCKLKMSLRFPLSWIGHAGLKNRSCAPYLDLHFLSLCPKVWSSQMALSEKLMGFWKISYGKSSQLLKAFGPEPKPVPVKLSWRKWAKAETKRCFSQMFWIPGDARLNRRIKLISCLI